MATFIVNRADDVTDESDGLLTLREAIALANETEGADTIEFDSTVFSGNQTITLDGNEIEITDALTITGTGQDALAIDGDATSRVFHVTSETAPLTVENLTIQNGSAVHGGGLYSNSDVTITNSVITGNQALEAGGGIYNRGTLTANNSTISYNSSFAGGGSFKRQSNAH